MMKLIIFLLMLPFIFSCSRDAEIENKSIAAVDFPSFDAARAIMGSDENIHLLLPPGAESHSYEPTPKDMIAISSADLVIFTGGPSDEWVYTILESLPEEKLTYVLTEQVELICTDEEHHHDHHEHKHEHEHEHNHGDIDEHVWTSPVNEIEIVKNLIPILASLYPDEAEEYERNGNAYIEELKAIDREIRSIVESAKNRTMVFASRFPLTYFTEEYGIEHYEAFPGCAEESEPSAKTVASLIDVINENELGYVFNIEFGSPMIAKVIAEETGSTIREFHTIHNLTMSDFSNGESYVSLMRRNIEVLKEALR